MPYLVQYHTFISKLNAALLFLKMKLFLFLLFLSAFQGYAQITPLLNAHAHNDYENTRPLVDAYEHGFISVEADVHLIEEKLYVSHHTPNELNDNLLLEKMYLQPLMDITAKNDGKVYPDDEEPFLLMIDFKTDARPTYEALKLTIQPYQSMLCKASESKGCAVKIFISGNRPVEQVLSEPEGFLALDGRPEDLGQGIPASSMPVVSENYKKINSSSAFKGLSRKDAITAFADKVHKEGKKIRLWGASDNPDTWQNLLDWGVDLINTDKLEEFSLFMREDLSEVD